MELNADVHIVEFGFPLDFQSTWSIKFTEWETGGFSDNFTSKRNHPRINQHSKINLQIWMANFDLQIL